MPQDDLKKAMKKVKDYHTTSELSDMIDQSAPSVRRMIKRMWEQKELKRTIVQRGHQKNIFAYKLKM